MRNISKSIAPAFACHIILEQEGEQYRFKKNVINPELLETLITQQQCDEYLNDEHRVCVKMNDRNRIYNFEVQDPWN